MNGNLRPASLKSIPGIFAPVEGMGVATVKLRLVFLKAKETTVACIMTKLTSGRAESLQTPAR